MGRDSGALVKPWNAKQLGILVFIPPKDGKHNYWSIPKEDHPHPFCQTPGSNTAKKTHTRWFKKNARNIVFENYVDFVWWNSWNWMFKTKNFPKIGGRPQIIQVMDEHFSIETHGDLGLPHDLRNHQLCSSYGACASGTTEKRCLGAKTQRKRGCHRHERRWEMMIIGITMVLTFPCLFQLEIR